MLEKLNYKHNKTISLPDDYINGQGVGEVAKMKYGICTMAWNGCEMIALYNAMRFIGQPYPLEKIALEMYPRSQVAFGFFGSNVYALGGFFKRHGVQYSQCLSYNDFFNHLKEHKCAVCSFWNHRVLFGSLHTVMVRHENGKIIVYNRSNRKTEPVKLNYRSELTSKKLFIIGYFVD